MGDGVSLGRTAAVLMALFSLSSMTVDGAILEYKSEENSVKKLDIREARQLLHRQRRAAGSAADSTNATNPAQVKHVIAEEVVLNGTENHMFAYVRWTGKLSEAIIILTVEYGRSGIADSQVWRSQDFGTSYSKVSFSDDALIAHFYVSPADHRKMVFVDYQNKCLYTTDDEADTYQNVSLPVAASDILMHPENSSWMLLHDSHGRQLYVTMDFGASWTLLESDVNGRTYWGVKGYDDPTIVHMEIQPEDSNQAYYKRCTIPDCKAAGDGIDNHLGPFMVYSMLVKNEFIFVQKANLDGTNSHMMVSHMRENFSHTYFPGSVLTMDVMVLDASEGQVFLAVIHGVDTGASLYLSDPKGQYYVLSLNNVNHFSAYHYLFQVDIHKVQGLNGIYLANQLLDDNSGYPKRMKTVVSFNKGGTWLDIPSPKDNDCDKNCSLVLRLDMGYYTDTVMSVKEAPGFIIAHGYNGYNYEYGFQNISVFSSSDGGWTWIKSPLHGFYHFNILDQGSLVIAYKTGYQHNASYIDYSYDEGKSWHHEQIGNKTFVVRGVVSEPSIDALAISIYGLEHYSAALSTIKLNFSQVLSRKCDSSSDYVDWMPSDHDSSVEENCLLGQEVTYRRRKSDSVCYNGEGFVRTIQKTACECGQEDFECDFGYSMQDNDCKEEPWFDAGYIAPRCTEHQPYNKSRGYRKVGSDKCVGGVSNSTKYQLDTEALCPLVKPDQLLLSANATVIATGKSVQFHLSQKRGSISTTQYEWLFNDTHNATFTGLEAAQQQIHRFSYPGIFDVKVVASNSDGEKTSNIVRVRVEYPVRIMSLFYTWAVRVGFPVQVSVSTNVRYSSSDGSLHFLYRFGDESSTGKDTLTWDADVSHTYNTSGVYTLSISAINSVSAVTKQVTIKVIDDGVLLQLGFSSNASQLFGYASSRWFHMEINLWMTTFRQKLTLALGIRTERLSLSLYSTDPLYINALVMPKSSTSLASEMTAEQIGQTIVEMVENNTLSFGRGSPYYAPSYGDFNVTSVQILSNVTENRGGNDNHTGDHDHGDSDHGGDHPGHKKGINYRAVYISVPIILVAGIITVVVVIVFRRRSRNRYRYSQVNTGEEANPFLDDDDLLLDMSDARDTRSSRDDAMLNLGSGSHLVMVTGSGAEN